MNYELLRNLQSGTQATNRELTETLLNEIDFQREAQLEKGLELIAGLMTKRSYSYPVAIIGPSYWREAWLRKQTDEPGRSNGLMARAPTGAEQHLFELFEENFGSARETVHFLDDQKDPHIVPYLIVLLQNVAQALGLGHDLKRDVIEKMVDQNRLLLRFCQEKIEQGIPLKQFGG